MTLPVRILDKNLFLPLRVLVRERVDLYEFRYISPWELFLPYFELSAPLLDCATCAYTWHKTARPPA
jgi:hypothetical protein